MCSIHAADAVPEKQSHRFDAEGIPGKLVIGGGGTLPDSILQRFVTLAGGEKARLVVIPTAASREEIVDHERVLAPWKKYSLAAVSVLHATSRAEADRPDFCAVMKEATAVWFGGGQQSRIADTYVGTRVELELTALLERGGVIGGTSAGAAVMTRRMIAGGNPQPRLAQGLDLLPDAVVDQHFLQRNRKPRLLQCLAEHPTTFGLGIDEGTAVIVDGRRMEVIGTAKVTICLPASPKRPAKEYEMKEGDSADLVALRRAVHERCHGSWPAGQDKLAAPIVPTGSLILGGGGRLPAVAIERFIELAGGPDSLIVILPTASESTTPSGMSEQRMFARAGAKNLAVLSARTTAEVDSEDFLAKVATASGVWFGGGRQWRFVDAYDGTRAVDAFRAVLQRGGVIGGSSAGASIQADYLVRGSPLGNTEMMSEGYERGFCFLPGTAVDQHFSQRGRSGDMEALVDAYPQFLGIGIDESTALVVRGSTASVVGEHSAWFFDRSTPTEPRKSIQVLAGQAFDLIQRSIVQSTGG